MTESDLNPGQETPAHPAPSLLTSEHKRPIGLSLVLLITTIALYFPVIHHPFANIDDQGYVYDNQRVQAGLTWATAKWAFRSIDCNNWHPLTWLSHALDCQIFGIDPAGHHAINMLWHAINVVVLFWVLLKATGFLWRSFMVAALFALHPINVESVAWTAERKTLLSTLFFLLALGAYRRYTASQAGTPPKVFGGLGAQQRIWRYSVVALLFILGLMAKPQIITLPCVLLLWDYWPLRRIFVYTPNASTESVSQAAFPTRRFFWLVKEKVPLFLICAASALVTLKAQHAGRPEYWPYSAWVRIGNSIVAYVRYIGKALWPTNLAIMYLHPGSSLRAWQVIAALLLLLAVTALALKRWRHRYLPVGWLWFLGTLIPTIGLIQVGRQALADRYAYQSFLGLFIIVCWAAADWAKRWHLPKALLPSVSFIILAVLGVLTYRQIGYWNDNLTLWSHTLQATENNWVANKMVGLILAGQGHREDAMRHFRAAAALNPSEAGVSIFLALEEQQHGNLQEAIHLLRKAVTEMDNPKDKAKVYQLMAEIYRSLGDSTQSRECLSKAASLRGQ